MYIETLCKYNKLLGNIFMQTVRELEPKCSFVSLVKYYNSAVDLRANLYFRKKNISYYFILMKRTSISRYF